MRTNSTRRSLLRKLVRRAVSLLVVVITAGCQTAGFDHSQIVAQIELDQNSALFSACTADHRRRLEMHGSCIRMNRRR